MCLLASFWTHEIDSTPPATTTSFSPAMTRCAAIAIVCRPLEQKRFTVMPLVVIGRPARSAIWRAMLLPVAPSGVAQPMMTSSTSAGSMPARSTAALTAWPPSVAPCVMLKAPFQLLASGVRAVETMTALVMGCCCGEGKSDRRAGGGIGRRRVADQLVIELDELDQVRARDALVGAVEALQILEARTHRRELVDVVGDPVEVARIGRADHEA